MKSQHLKKNCFSHPNIVPAKKCSAKNYTCKIFEKSSFEPSQKSNFHVVLYQKQKKTFFRYELKIIQEIKTFSAGNQTPVSNVTGWDTSHYTTKDTLPRISSKFMSFEILKLQNDTIELDQRSGIPLYTTT